MSRIIGIGTALARQLRSRFSSAPRERRGQQRLGDVVQLVGRDLAGGGLREKVPIWLIPAMVVCGVIVALAIANLRVQLIGQGYKRASAVTRHQELEEEQRNLAARVRELRDPARLASLAQEMGFIRPERAFALAPPGIETRP
jgi:cell division protein FtsL